MEQMKVCSKCKIEKPLEAFHKSKNTKDGHVERCKNCRSISKRIKENLPDGYQKCTKCTIIKQFNCFNKDRQNKNGFSYSCKECTNKRYRENEGHIKAKQKEWRNNNKAYITHMNNEYEKKNSDKLKISRKKYKKDNAENIIKYQKQYQAIYVQKPENKIKRSNRIKQKSMNDLSYRMANNLRKRGGRAITDEWKSGSFVNDLGCSIKYFKQYIEEKFYNRANGEQMSWDNWAMCGWHLDHIIPLASFDLTNREQFLKACHYTNLQPLWAEDNLAKADKLNWKK